MVAAQALMGAQAGGPRVGLGRKSSDLWMSVEAATAQRLGMAVGENRRSDLGGFPTMLRPGEAAAPLRAHLRLPDPQEREAGIPGVISLTKTKTTSRGARLQSVIIRDKPLL